MDESLMHELNENLKRLLGNPQKQTKKEKTEEEKVNEWRQKIRLKYLKKNLKKRGL